MTEPTEPTVTQRTIEIINEVAYDCEEETEYDGKMRCSCFYCGASLDPGGEYDKNLHDEDCTHVKARELLKYLK